MTSRILRVLSCLLVLALAPVMTPALAAPLLIDGTDNPGFRFNDPYTIGFDFTPAINLNLTALGLWDLDADGPHPALGHVGLWLTSDGSLLASATITAADPIDSSVVVEGGSWRYQTLASPVALVASTTYTLGFLVSEIISSPESLYLDFATLSSNPNVTVDNIQRFLETSTLEFPTGIRNPADTFFPGIVNAQLTIPRDVPEPMSLLLFGAGLVAVATHRSRGRR